MTKNEEKHLIGGKEGFTKRTICEVLREIYWETKDETIREKAMEATKMAKRMDAKLRQYKGHWDKHEWEEIPDAKAIAEKRRRLAEEEK